MSNIKRIMNQYRCDEHNAQDYLDLLEDGYSSYQAKVMAGLIDPDQ